MISYDDYLKYDRAGIRDRYLATHGGTEPSETVYRHLEFRVLREGARFESFASAMADWGGGSPTEPPTSGDGLRHPWQRSTGAFLFSRREFWIPDSRYLGSPPDVQDAMIADQKAIGATHFLVTANVGPGKIPVVPWSGAERVAETRLGLRRIIDADLAPAVMISSQTYFDAMLLGNLSAFLKLLDRFVPQIEDLCSWICAMWEIGDIFRDENDRKSITKAIRAVTRKPIGIHERSLEGPYRKEVIGFAPTIALLQFGFRTTVDDAVDFVTANKRRLDRHGCETACFEHSIPPWGPWRASRQRLDEAKIFGQEMLQAGCIFDMNGAAVA